MSSADCLGVTDSELRAHAESVTGSKSDAGVGFVTDGDCLANETKGVPDAVMPVCINGMCNAASPSEAVTDSKSVVDCEFVTANDCLPAETNGVLTSDGVTDNRLLAEESTEAILARIAAVFGGPLSAEEREYRAALSEAKICGCCGKEIATHREVFLGRRTHRCPPPIGRWGHGSAIVPFGACCIPSLNGFIELGPCGGCGRHVWLRASRAGIRHGFYQSRRRYAYCSERCKQAVYAAEGKAKRTRRRAARKSQCVACGKEFSLGRSDARTCSSACRQRAYRQRKGK